MPRVRLYVAPHRPKRVRRRRGRRVATPWAPDATGRPRIRLENRPWIPEWASANGRQWLMGWYCPTFGCDWYMPHDDELD